jgi:hypothetical protein
MHPSKNEENHAKLAAFEFDRLPKGSERGLGLERQSDVTNVDEIEADDQQAVYRIGQSLVPRNASIRKRRPPLWRARATQMVRAMLMTR